MLFRSRYLQLLTLLVAGWAAAQLTASFSEKPPGDSVRTSAARPGDDLQASDAPDAQGAAPLVLRKHVALSIAHPTDRIPSNVDAKFLAQLPHPPAALVEQAARAEELADTRPVPHMSEKYESLFDENAWSQRPSGEPYAPRSASRAILKPVARKHTIREGDTLPKLAARYLGSAARYQELFDANRDVLERPDVLPLGATLRIP